MTAPSRLRPHAPREPIYGLDFIRFGAAMAVMAYHLGFTLWVGAERQSFLNVGHALPPWWQLTWPGWVGVQTFFVVSGVVISYSLAGVTWREFAARRVLRLVPAAWIAATIALAIVLLARGMPPAQAVAQYARVMIFLPLGPSLLPPFWTLPIECAFYAVITLLVATGQSHRMEALAAVMTLGSFAYQMAWHTVFPREYDFVSALLLLQHGAYFGLGIMLTRAAQAGWSVRRIIVCSVGLATSWFEVADRATVEPLPAWLARQFVFPWLGFVLSVVAIALSLQYRHAIARACAPFGKQIRVLGLITYPLYLVHMHTGAMALQLALSLGIAPTVAVCAAMLGAVAVAYVILKWLEPPVRAVLARRLA